MPGRALRVQLHELVGAGRDEGVQARGGRAAPVAGVDGHQLPLLRREVHAVPQLAAQRAPPPSRWRAKIPPADARGPARRPRATRSSGRGNGQSTRPPKVSRACRMRSKKRSSSSWTQRPLVAQQRVVVVGGAGGEGVHGADCNAGLRGAGITRVRTRVWGPERRNPLLDRVSPWHHLATWVRGSRATAEALRQPRRLNERFRTVFCFYLLVAAARDRRAPTRRSDQRSAKFRSWDRNGNDVLEQGEYDGHPGQLPGPRRERRRRLEPRGVRPSRTRRAGGGRGGGRA